MNVIQPLRSPQTIRICIVEDDHLNRDGFALSIDDTCGMKIVNTYGCCEDALKNIHTDAPDVLLMDIAVPGRNGIEGIARIKKRRPKTNILVVTFEEQNDLIFKALGAGAGGYLTKNLQPTKLLEAIWDIQAGGAPMSANVARIVVASFQKSSHSPLTTRETEVLELLSKGKSYTTIAEQLFVDKETIRTHIKNIYWKLEVHSKADAIEKATKERFI